MAIFSLIVIGNFFIVLYTGYKAAKADLDSINCGMVGSLIHAITYAIIVGIGIFLWRFFYEFSIDEDLLQMIGLYLISCIFANFIIAFAGAIIAGAKNS
jgi:hypothetical protein